MKKLFIAICGGALLFSGCKEHDAPVDFSTTTAAGDTTYVVTPVPPATSRQVLVEEFTGQSCPNCPQAHGDLDAISAANPGLINVVSMYTTGQPQANPPAGALYDFRTTSATTIGNTVFNGIPGLPAAAIDRVSASGSVLQLGSGSWDGIINNELKVVDSINLSVTSAYDTASKKATITALVTYLYPLSTPQNLSIYIVEDSMSDLQEFSSGDQTYLFMDVFRDMVTPPVPWGAPLTVSGTNNKAAGQFFQRIYPGYSLPAPVGTSPAINPAHCRVIAFVSCANDGTDYHVMQSAQCKFAP